MSVTLRQPEFLQSEAWVWALHLMLIISVSEEISLYLWFSASLSKKRVRLSNGTKMDSGEYKQKKGIRKLSGTLQDLGSLDN